MENSQSARAGNKYRVGDPTSARSGPRLFRKHSRPRPLLRRWALIAAVAALATGMLSCGTAATLHVIAPATAVAGDAFTITVSATIGTSPDTVINSPIQLTSSDKAAVIYPSYYEFSASDAGSHTFVNGVTLKTVGNQTITATVVGAPGLTATAHVTVTAPAP